MHVTDATLGNHDGMLFLFQEIQNGAQRERPENWLTFGSPWQIHRPSECVLVPEKTRSIRDAIAAGTSQYGMQTFDQSLWDLFQAGLVNYETALENASNADDFKLRMQGIASSSDISRQSMQSAGFGGR